MATPASRSLQAQLAVVVWEGIAAGLDESAVIRALHQVLAQIVSVYVREQSMDLRSVVAQMEREFRTLLDVGAEPMDQAPPPTRRKKR